MMDKILQERLARKFDAWRTQESIAGNPLEYPEEPRDLFGAYTAGLVTGGMLRYEDAHPDMVKNVKNAMKMVEFVSDEMQMISGHKTMPNNPKRHAMWPKFERWASQDRIDAFDIVPLYWQAFVQGYQNYMSEVDKDKANDPVYRRPRDGG